MRHQYTIKELSFLREHYPSKGAKWCAEQLGLKPKAVAQYARKQGIRYKGPILGGFKKGGIPWNKGKKYDNPRSRATRFKKGQEPANARITEEPYLRDDHGTPYYWIRPRSGRVMPYHRYLWIEHYGQPPKGHVIAFKDGDTLNCNINNLICLSRSENCRRLASRTDIDRTQAGKKSWATRDKNMRKRLGLPIK